MTFDTDYADFLRPFVAPGDRAKLEYAERELSRPERAQAEHPDFDVLTDVRNHVLRRAEIRAEEATA